MKFRVDRDVLADAVAWAARSLPVRPSVPVLAGLLIEASDDGPGALDLRLRDLRPRHAHRRGHRRGQGAGQRPAARRHLPQPAGQAGRDGARRRPRSRSPAARRGSACRRCRSRTTPRCPTCRPPPARSPATSSPTPSPRPSPPPAATTCCRCSPASASRSTARRSRCWPPTGSGSPTASSTWNPQHPRRVAWPRWCPAKVLGDTAKSLTAGSEVTIALGRGRHRRGHHRLRGRRPRRRTSYDDPAARRRVPQGPQPVPQRAPDHRARSTRPR